MRYQTICTSFKNAIKTIFASLRFLLVKKCGFKIVYIYWKHPVQNMEDMLELARGCFVLKFNRFRRKARNKRDQLIWQRLTIKLRQMFLYVSAADCCMLFYLM